MQCIAITSGGKQCRNTAKLGGEFCGIHDRRDNKIAPFAESLPDTLVTDFANSLDFQNILSNRNDIAYLEAQKAELLRRQGGGHDYFNELGEAWKEYKTCEKMGDTQGLAAAIRNVGDLIEKGKRSEKWKRDHLDLIERTRRLRQDEMNAEIKIGLLLPTAQVILEMQQFTALVLAAASRIMSPDDYARLAPELIAIRNNPPLLEAITKNTNVITLN